ncbi:MAG: GTP-binding protein [Prevotella sp.]|nr:GTP-binding protein [Prevotella sp.]
MNKMETPVLLLTGYLGSGKTTLLNRILQNKKEIKFAVIVNDIGEVNIDADLIEKGGIVNEQDDSLVALQNGCICCTLKMDLVKQLQDIIALHRFDYIVIEASGICEPAPIAQTICSIPQMAPEVTAEGYPRLDSIVTVVDALRMKDEFGNGNDLLKQNIEEDDIENLVIQQIEFCNIVLLNKAADVEPQELGRIREIIRTLQPKAEIIDCNYGDVDLDKIINTHMFDFNEVATSAAWIAEIEGHHDDDDDEEDEEHEHHHHHDHEGGEVEEYGIGTYVYYRRPAFDLGRFDEFVARKWPKNIIRAKGICYFDDEKQTCYVFEQAGKQVSLRNAGQWYATMPKNQLAQFLQQNPGVMRDWDVKYGDRMQKLVFIGQHLDKKEIERLLDECLA